MKFASNMGVTGYEKLTNEEIEAKLRSLETIKYNLEREQRHRKEAEERKKYEDVIGKYFFSNTTHAIFQVQRVENENTYIGKYISFVSTAGMTLMPLSAAIHFSIEPKFSVTDLSDYVPISKEEVKEIVSGWKRHVNDYINFVDFQ